VGLADSQQITASGGTPPYTFSWAGTLPPGLSLSANGAISGTPTTAGSYQFTVKASDTSTPATTGSQAYTMRVAAGAVTISLSPATLPAAAAGVADSQRITASGGTPPYTFSWAGTLPPGLSLSANGAISGTPTTAGSYQFTITAIDSSPGPNKASEVYTLQVAPGTITITLDPTAVPDGSACTSYNQTITASGGTGPYSFSVSSGSLPPGLSLSPAGVITGSPGIDANGQSYPFTVQATDSSATPISGTQAYTLNVAKGIGSCIL
jgi:large repetitive protein